jgi:hypothetical protein
MTQKTLLHMLVCLLQPHGYRYPGSLIVRVLDNKYYAAVTDNLKACALLFVCCSRMATATRAPSLFACWSTSTTRCSASTAGSQPSQVRTVQCGKLQHTSTAGTVTLHQSAVSMIQHPHLQQQQRKYRRESTMPGGHHTTAHGKYNRIQLPSFSRDIECFGT